jgi:hypothetical protein
VQQTIVLGSAVRCPDGKGGSISQIVLNPKTNALEYVIVHRGIFGGHDHCVPAGHIHDASVEGVTLMINTDELKALPDSGYYAWRVRSVNAHAERDRQLTAQIRSIFTDSRRTYGSPRVHAELQAHGVRTARKRVARLMRQAQLYARPRRQSVRTTASRHSEPIAPNLLSRTFQAEEPNRVWSQISHT